MTEKKKIISDIIIVIITRLRLFFISYKFEVILISIILEMHIDSLADAVDKKRIKRQSVKEKNREQNHCI